MREGVVELNESRGVGYLVCRRPRRKVAQPHGRALGQRGREASQREVASQVVGIKRSPTGRVIPTRGREVIKVVARRDVVEGGVGGTARSEQIKRRVGKSEGSAATTGRAAVLVENRRERGPRWRRRAGAADRVPAGHVVISGID